MPFRISEKKKDKLVCALSVFFRNETFFSLTLKDYDAFAPKVIYVTVSPSPDLSNLQKKLGQLMAQKLAIHNSNYRKQAFHPHITIAFRDLKKSRFYEAWDYFKHQSFQGEFQVNHIVLLQHNGKTWEQEIAFELSK